MCFLAITPSLLQTENVLTNIFSKSIFLGNRRRRWDECCTCIKGGVRNYCRITTSITIALSANTSNHISWEELHHYFSITDWHFIKCYAQLTEQLAFMLKYLVICSFEQRSQRYIRKLFHSKALIRRDYCT